MMAVLVVYDEESIVISEKKTRIIILNGCRAVTVGGRTVPSPSFTVGVRTVPVTIVMVGLSLGMLLRFENRVPSTSCDDESSESVDSQGGTDRQWVPVW